MPFIDVHPAPGLGEMLPGWFVVPNNPFQPREPVSVGTGVGAILPMQAQAAMQARNVLIDAARSVGRGPGEKGDGPVVIHGLGAINLQDVVPSQWSWQVWAAVIAGALILLSMTRKNRLAYKAAKHAAKAQYYEALAAAKSRSPVLPVYAYRSIRGA